MLYCPKCQVVSIDEKTCPSCGGKKLRTPEQDDPVLLLTADEFKTERIEAIFQENSIPYEERINGLGGPMSIILGKTSNTNKNIFVPFEKLDSCKELLNGVGILDAADAELVKNETKTADAQVRRVPPDDRTEYVEMSRGKRFFWRAVSVVLFIVLIWAVVAVSDFAAEGLKVFFTGK
jgi:hypothetical protein